MTIPPILDAQAVTIGKVGVAIIGGIVALALWGARVEVQLTTKADRTTVEMMSRDIQTILRVVCKDANPDSACKR